MSEIRTNAKKATRLCPCGYLGDPRCRCTGEQVARYRARISGPLIERIDLHVELPPVDERELFDQHAAGESSAAAAARVAAAHALQRERRGSLNHRLAGCVLQHACRLGTDEIDLLKRGMRRLGLSARSLHRVLRVARTVADLAGSDDIGTSHLAEALGYRRLNRAAESTLP